MSLSVSTKSAGAAPSRVWPGAFSPDVVIGTAGAANSITITSAQLVFSRIERVARDSDCAASSGDATAECEDLELGPTLVDVPADGTTSTALTSQLPAGTYAGLEAKLDAVQSGEGSGAAFLAAHPGWSGVNVQVSGTYVDGNGASHAFTYQSAAEAELEMVSATPITVGGTSGQNVTIDIDVASWFRDGSGAAIDPTNAANASTIDGNISHSFSAFDDDNKDGSADR